MAGGQLHCCYLLALRHSTRARATCAQEGRGGIAPKWRQQGILRGARQGVAFVGRRLMCKGGGAGGMAHSLPRATIVALPLCVRVAPWVDAGRVGIAAADHTGAVRGVCCRTSCHVARRRHAASSDAGVHGGHVGDEVVHAGGVAVLCGGAGRGGECGARLSIAARSASCGPAS